MELFWWIFIPLLVITILLAILVVGTILSVLLIAFYNWFVETELGHKIHYSSQFKGISINEGGQHFSIALMRLGAMKVYIGVVIGNMIVRVFYRDDKWQTQVITIQQIEKEFARQLANKMKGMVGEQLWQSH